MKLEIINKIPPFGGYSGERISRHNMLRDAIFEVAAAAALNPVKEGRFLLQGQIVALQMCSSAAGKVGKMRLWM